MVKSANPAATSENNVRRACLRAYRGAEKGATRGCVGRGAPNGLCCRGCLGGGCWVGWVVRFNYTARPPPPVILPGAAFAALCLAGASRRASPFGLALPRVDGGRRRVPVPPARRARVPRVDGAVPCQCRSACASVGVSVSFSYTARPPPPVILPGAAFALLCLAGAFAPGFALRARAAACRWGRLVVLSP